MDFRNQLLILLLADENPIWKSILNREAEKDEPHKLLNYEKHNRISRHSGKHMRPRRFAELIATLGALIDQSGAGNAEELKSRVDSFVQIYNTAEETEKEVGLGATALGYAPLAYRRLLELDSPPQYPLLPQSLYDDGNEAKKVCREIAGLYMVTMKRGDQVACCPLWIKYVVPVDGKFAIRCHLRVRSTGALVSDEHRWGYDGLVTMRNGPASFWMFSKIKDTDKEEILDMIFMISKSFLNKYARSDYIKRLDQDEFAGEYFTSSQSDEQDALHDTMTITRLPDSEAILADEDAIERFLHDECRIEEAAP